MPLTNFSDTMPKVWAKYKGGHNGKRTDEAEAGSEREPAKRGPERGQYVPQFRRRARTGIASKAIGREATGVKQFAPVLFAIIY